MRDAIVCLDAVDIRQNTSFHDDGSLVVAATAGHQCLLLAACDVDTQDALASDVVPASQTANNTSIISCKSSSKG